MPFISSRIFVAGGTKKLMTLQNEEHVRFIGTDWTTLRIGMLCAIQDNAGANVTGRLGIGVCAGQTNPLGNPTNTTNFFGSRNLSGAGATWTYTANSGDPYFANGSFYGLMRQGNVDTTAGVATTNINIVTTALGNGSLQRRSLVIVDISKGGTQAFYTGTAQFNADYMVGDFLSCLEASNVFVTPTFRAITLTASTSQAPAGFNQTPGLLDCLDIHWTGTAQAFEIYALGVFRKT
jgi:hypothetical protein